MYNKDEVISFSQDLGKAIGNSTRFKILDYLGDGPRTVSEIVEYLKISQPTTSQHLLILKNSKMITSEKRGMYVYYSINLGYLIRGLKNMTAVLEDKSQKSKEHITNSATKL